MSCILIAVSLFAQPGTYPKELLPFENSVCRVTVQDRGGTQSHGSGVLLESPEKYEGNTYVYTCYHVVRDRSYSPEAIRVTWDGENYYQATMAAARPGCDGCLLLIKDPPQDLPRIPIADTDIAIGENAYGFGFGSAMSNTLRSDGGKVYELSMNMAGDHVWFSFKGQFRQGDSGGPIFVVRDHTPQLVGCGWGTAYDSNRGHYHITGTRLTVIRRLFGKETAPVTQHQQGTGARTIVTVGGGGS